MKIQKHLWAIRPVALIGLALAVAWFAYSPSVRAGVYSISIQSPANTNVGTTFNVTVTASLVKDQYANGQVLAKFMYNPRLVKLVYAHNGNYPETVSFTSDTSAGTVLMTAPNVGSGKGYGGVYTVANYSFTAINTGSAVFQVPADSVYDGTNHITVPSTSTIYAASCPVGQTGTPPNCQTIVTPTPTPTPIPTPIPTPVTPTPSPSPLPSTSSSSSTKSSSSTSQSTTKTSSSSSNTTALACTPTPSTATPQSDSLFQDSSIDLTGSNETVTPTILTATSHQVTATSFAVTYAATGPISTPSFNYGTVLDNLSKTTSVTQNGNAVSVALSNLDPGISYYYDLTVTNCAGTVTQHAGTFNTPGYPVTLTIKDNHGQPLAKHEVYVGTSVYTTDNTGQLQLLLKSGPVTVKSANKQLSSQFIVKAESPAVDGSLKTQTVSLQLVAVATKAPAKDKVKKTSWLPVVYIGVGALLLVIILLSVLVRRSHRQAHRTMTPTTNPGELPSPQPPVVVAATVPNVVTPFLAASQEKSDPTKTKLAEASLRAALSGSKPFAGLSTISTNKGGVEDPYKDYDPFLQSSPFYNGPLAAKAVPSNTVFANEPPVAAVSPVAQKKPAEKKAALDKPKRQVHIPSDNKEESEEVTIPMHG